VVRFGRGRLGAPGTVSTGSVATATSATSVLSYTVPAGAIAFVAAMSIILLAGTAPVMRVQYTPAGGAAQVISQDTLVSLTQLLKQLNLWLAPGDLIEWYVQTGGAGSSVSAYISVQQISDS
jgi:hypothetical protein